MAKRLILTLMFTMCYIVGNAQEKTLQTLMNEFATASKEADQLSQQKQYAQAAQRLEELTVQLPPCPIDSEKGILNYIGNTVYYHIARYQALAQNKKAAIKAFERSLDNGFYNYYDASHCPDFASLQADKDFQKLMERLEKAGNFKQLLKEASSYCNETKLPPFSYMSPNDSNLVRLRQQCNLDSVAGGGDELSKIKNLLTYIHNTIRHDGASMLPFKEKNALAIMKICKQENQGANCRMLATVLNECYLAMGFKSRMVTCLPKIYIEDCHVINTVYSVTLNKWLWVDPTDNAYVMDENGVMLGIAEVRHRLRSDQPLVLNEDANFNNIEKKVKEQYLDYYMAKNLYYIECPVEGMYDTETVREGKKRPAYIGLAPVGFEADYIGKNTYVTYNEALFWQSPYEAD